MPRDTIRRQAEVIDMLKEQIARLTHDKYGSGSERSLNGTLDLAEDEPPAPEAGEDAEEKPSAPLKRTRRLRRTSPAWWSNRFSLYEEMRL